MNGTMSDKQQSPESLLGRYRVLDLTNERGLLCGKILGDLGADVIKIEPPGGDPARNIGPFYKDILHPEKSLFWFALNTSKRGITLNIETADGQEIFRRLVKTADFVIESFEPGYLDKLDLGYSALEQINPRIIMTSITPFGSTGPYAHYKASDITLGAMGGFTYLSGEPDKAPCRISLPQSYLVGGLHGAMGSMIAHYYRESSGEGQHVDVSIQQGIIYFMMNAIEMWDVMRINTRRSGLWAIVERPTLLGPLRTQYYWPCKDGYVMFFLGGGAYKGFVDSSTALVELMEQEGMAGDLKGYDWRNFDTYQISQSELDRKSRAIAEFFLTKTKQQLYEAAIKKGIMLAPLCEVNDVVESNQLNARGYFVTVEHPELGDVITYPGAPIKLSEAPWKISHRAPLIGEHNVEIYENELGVSRGQLAILRGANVI